MRNSFALKRSESVKIVQNELKMLQIQLKNHPKCAIEPGNRLEHCWAATPSSFGRKAPPSVFCSFFFELFFDFFWASFSNFLSVRSAEFVFNVLPNLKNTGLAPPEHPELDDIHFVKESVWTRTLARRKYRRIPMNLVSQMRFESFLTGSVSQPTPNLLCTFPEVGKVETRKDWAAGSVIEVYSNSRWNHWLHRPIMFLCKFYRSWSVIGIKQRYDG